MKLISSILFAALVVVTIPQSQLEFSSESQFTSIVFTSAASMRTCTPVQPMAPTRDFCIKHNASPSDCRKMLQNYANYQSCKAGRAKDWIEGTRKGDVDECDPSKDASCLNYFKSKQ
jgi:hypothetical protein